jgi:hypothetical protein
MEGAPKEESRRAGIVFAFVSAVLTGGLIPSPALIVVLFAVFMAVFDGSFDCWERERERERESERERERANRDSQ